MRQSWRWRFPNPCRSCQLHSLNLARSKHTNVSLSVHFRQPILSSPFSSGIYIRISLQRIRCPLIDQSLGKPSVYALSEVLIAPMHHVAIRKASHTGSICDFKSGDSDNPNSKAYLRNTMVLIPTRRNMKTSVQMFC